MPAAEGDAERDRNTVSTCITAARIGFTVSPSAVMQGKRNKCKDRRQIGVAGNHKTDGVPGFTAGTTDPMDKRTESKALSLGARREKIKKEIAKLEAQVERYTAVYGEGLMSMAKLKEYTVPRNREIEAT